jgi:acetylornithine aminotransferase
LAVLRTIESDGLVAHADRVGKEIAAGIDALGHPLVEQASGSGLLIGVGLTAPAAAAVVGAARDAGFLVNNAAADRLRLAPPLILSHQQVGEFLTALPGILDAAGGADG